MSGKYDDIIGLPRPYSPRPKMPLNDRAFGIIELEDGFKLKVADILSIELTD